MDITAKSQIYFICPGFKEFLNKCVTHFEVGFYTSSQQTNVIEFFPYLLYKNGFKVNQFKFILTREYCTTMQRKEHYGTGNWNLYIKPLKSIWDVYGDYDAKNTVIIDDSMEKHVCNGKGNYIITNKKILWWCKWHIVVRPIVALLVMPHWC